MNKLLNEINQTLKIAGVSPLCESELPQFKKVCKIEMPSKSEGWEEVSEKEIDNNGEETTETIKTFSFKDNEKEKVEKNDDSNDDKENLRESSITIKNSDKYMLYWDKPNMYKIYDKLNGKVVYTSPNKEKAIQYYKRKNNLHNLKESIPGFEDSDIAYDEMIKAGNKVISNNKPKKERYLATIFTNYDMPQDTLEKEFTNIPEAKKWVNTVHGRGKKGAPYKAATIEKIFDNGEYATVADILWGDASYRYDNKLKSFAQWNDYPNNLQERLGETFDNIKKWSKRILMGAIVAAAMAFGMTRGNEGYQPTKWIPEDEFVEQVRVSEARSRWLGLKNESDQKFQEYLNNYELYNEDAVREWYHEKFDSIKPKQKTITENDNGNIDTITMDVPLFLRLLEYAKEDAKTDMDLHYVTENALTLMSNRDKLTMDCYDNIIAKQSEETI